MKTAMAMGPDLSHIHRFVPGSDVGRPPLLLLHGTGGNEDDLLPLGQMVAPGAALLSPRGRVSEAGMPRFFRRFAEGLFDEDDVRRRADDLADFVEAARARYGLAAPVAVGFSNGANIAAAVLYRRPQALAAAVLIRAMIPLSEGPSVPLTGKPVLILSGAMDPIVPASNAQGLAAALTAAGAAVRHEILPAGHGLTQPDITLARAFLARDDRAEG